MDMKRFLVISLLITMLSSKGMCQGFLGSLISGALNVMAESKKNKNKKKRLHGYLCLLNFKVLYLQLVSKVL